LISSFPVRPLSVVWLVGCTLKLLAPQVISRMYWRALGVCVLGIVAGQQVVLLLLLLLGQ
jgi:hypothetical protein